MRGPRKVARTHVDFCFTRKVKEMTMRTLLPVARKYYLVCNEPQWIQCPRIPFPLGTQIFSLSHARDIMNITSFLFIYQA